MSVNKHNDNMAYKVTFTKDDNGNVTEQRKGSIYATVHQMHDTIERYCDCCGAPMTPSDVNDYGTLCEQCYMREYYGEN